ncbi:hypothetical protein W911_16880 [Hyphomicrobium nitrativorans NL23]|uniref:Uncharacterized protein n=1 Tax=Hyphomicrobium nitrativorans NL23 TaxID=1029756 RepID=V5SHV9_9HYPH|nr:hypothetical protein W911_16880 [Hyphomicrobium nitrativorans NL23]
MPCIHASYSSSRVSSTVRYFGFEVYEAIEIHEKIWIRSADAMPLRADTVGVGRRGADCASRGGS